jgi:lipopolysaccharide biosynthesis glycosyltransferase
MNIIPIVFAFDNNLVLPACVCISSLMMNAKEDTFYDIFILHSERINLEKEQLDKIPLYYTNCRVQYRQIDNTFDSAYEIRGITTATYYRLLIPELIPEYDKIIYSDVDVVFREDLSDVYLSTELDDVYLAGVNSLFFLIPGYKKYYSSILNLDASKIIYAGNIILNSKLLVSKGIVSKFKDLIKNDYTYQDMDIINIACKGKIKQLPPSFCLTNYLNEIMVYHPDKLEGLWTKKEIHDALSRGIVHYNGQKPWKGYCVNFDIWWEYYRKSPFFDEKFYFDFFYNKLDELDRLTLWKRIKVLLRWFIVGRK